MKTVKVNAYIMHVFGKIELLSIHAYYNYFKMHYFNVFLDAKTYLYIAHWKYSRNMTCMNLVSNNCMKMDPWRYTTSKNLAADQGHHVLQYYINIIANTQQLFDMEDLFGTSAN